MKDITRCSQYNNRDCVMSSWSSWSICSNGCGSGQSTRTRRIISPAVCRGKACGATTESRQCTDYREDRGCVVRYKIVFTFEIFYSMNFELWLRNSLHHHASKVFLLLALFWRNRRERLRVNRVRSLLSMCGMLLRYSFGPRPKNHALATAGSFMTIGLSINGCSHSIKPV